MRWLRSIVVVVLLAGVGVLGVGAPACACDCGSRPPAQAFAEADAVFLGVVVDVATPWRGFSASSADPVTVTFAVDTVYKGVVPANARAQTARESPSCGYPFVAGQRYLVHVRLAADGTWRTGLCDGNQLVDEGGRTAVSRPAGGYPPGPAMSYPRAWPWPVLLAVTLAVGGLLSAAVLLVRARRRRMTPSSS